MGSGVLVVHASLAGVDPGSMKILYRFTDKDLTEKEISAITKEINTKVSLSNAVFEFDGVILSRATLVIKGMHSKLSSHIIGTDPLCQRQGSLGAVNNETDNLVVKSKPLPGCQDLKEAVESASLVNEFTEKSHIVLGNASFNKERIALHKKPVNMILCCCAVDYQQNVNKHE